MTRRDRVVAWGGRLHLRRDAATPDALRRRSAGRPAVRPALRLPAPAGSAVRVPASLRWPLQPAAVLRRALAGALRPAPRLRGPAPVRGLRQRPGLRAAAVRRRAVRWR